MQGFVEDETKEVEVADEWDGGRAWREVEFTDASLILIV